MVFAGAIKLNKRGYALAALLILLFIYYIQVQYSHSDDINVSQLLKTAIIAANLGGKFVVNTKNHLSVHVKGKTKEGMDDSVTTADLLSHCVMKQLIERRLPNVKFISEEKEVDCEEDLSGTLMDPETSLTEDVAVRGSDVTIWIDPLDATHEYTEKLYEYVTTMVCVAVKGEPLIGVIYKPFSETTFWAVVGYGHSNNLKPKANNAKSDKTKIIVSRSHRGAIEKVLEENFKHTPYEMVIAAGAGYKALEVAEGSVDAYLHITAIKKWDICAGNAILKALGGKMTDKNGNSLTYFNETNVLNEHGLIATLNNHEQFVNKI
ncbi:unnamed protein product [Ceutorhynchus assimilis]|uniref:inositol-phosphate phosphatase n=1 Tax=Ceutorhynchus assimilis TaxID=467358 RepID=A0A9N9MEM4_9CUCU|nr:unnamed protein product [Ceutorhynchus assimilis]